MTTDPDIVARLERRASIARLVEGLPELDEEAIATIRELRLMETRLYEEVCALRARNAALDTLTKRLEREGMEMASQIERLRAALRPLADIADRIDGVPPQPHYPDDMDVATVLASAHRVTLGQARVARRVLEGEG